MTQFDVPIPRSAKRGLALPATRSPGGYFAAESPLETALSDLIQALFTPVKSRPLQRQFGSRLREKLFQPNVDVNEDSIRQMVVTAAQRWVPQISIQDVQVNPDSPTRQSLTLAITFTLVGDETPVDRLIRINRANESFEVIDGGT